MCIRDRLKCLGVSPLNRLGRLKKHERAAAFEVVFNLLDNVVDDWWDKPARRPTSGVFPRQLAGLGQRLRELPDADLFGRGVVRGLSLIHI